MRVATIDIGTNSVLLLVAEITPRGLVAVEERATVTRLGQGVDRTGVLAPAAIERTTACLEIYAERVRALGAERVAVAGTSALRDASGGEIVASFLASKLGTPLRVISGRDEARLTFLGALSGLDEETPGPQWAIDVGGGSTEFVRGVRTAPGDVVLQYAESFDVGSVRLTERCIEADPPRREDLDRVSAAADGAFAPIPVADGASTPIGIAGTVTTLASVSLAMVDYDGARVHGHVLARGEIERVVDHLARLDVDARRAVPGLHAGRADVIVAGGLIVLAALRRLGSSSLRVSDRGLRWGLAQDLARASRP